MSRLWHSPWLLAALLGTFTLSLYLLTGSSDLLHNGDTDLRIQTTQAIVEHGRLWLDHPSYTDARVARGLGGHLYAFYAPGQSVLMIPLYVIGKAVAHHLNLPYTTTEYYAARSLDLFLGAALAVVFFLFALVAGYRRRVAGILTLLFAVGSVAWPDAQSALEQTQVNLFLLVAVLGLWLYLREPQTSRRWLILAGAGVGLAVFTRYDAFLYAPLFAALILLFRRPLRAGPAARDVLAFGAGLVPWILLVALWNVVRFGSPFLTGLHEDTLGNPVGLGILDLTVSPGKGLIWYLPLLLALPWAVRPFYRRVPTLAIICAAMVALPLLFYAAIRYWHGDPAWGPRYLYVAVPYLLLPLGEILSRWASYRFGYRALFVALAAVCVAVQVAAVSVTQWRFWYRLQAMQEQSANTNLWLGQPFRWGSQYYHYYWNVRESPILIQADDLFQVLRIMAGNQAYLESGQPDPLLSGTTAVIYPVNTLAFWWKDPLHPLLGPHTRDAIAALLALSAGASLTLVLILLRGPEVPLSADDPSRSDFAVPARRRRRPVGALLVAGRGTEVRGPFGGGKDAVDDGGANGALLQDLDAFHSDPTRGADLVE
jgi:hypothetical protein